MLVSGLLNVRCSDVEYGKLEIIERDALHYNEEYPAFPQIGVKYYLPAALGRYY